MFIPPPGPRYKVTDNGSELRIAIPSRKNIFIILFLGFWLCGWAVGAVMVPYSAFLKGHAHSAPLAFTLAWSARWYIGGTFALYTWFWQVAGWEIITVSAATCSVKRDIFGIGPMRQYDPQHIKNLRILPYSYVANSYSWDRSLQFWGLTGGTICFDYGSSTVRCGISLDEAEASVIVEAMRRQLGNGS